MTAFYQPLGDGRFAPTRATKSPWDGGMQHGGPPAALLAHVMAPGGDLRLTRIAVDFLGRSRGGSAPSRCPRSNRAG